MRAALAGARIPHRRLHSYSVDLDSTINAGTTDATGITLTGLRPSSVYALSEVGSPFVAWKPQALQLWKNEFSVTDGAGETLYGSNTGPGNGYATAALALAAFPGGTITGYSTYTFWIHDTPIIDNTGGVSILITELP